MSEEMFINIMAGFIMAAVVLMPGIITAKLYAMSRRGIFASHRGHRVAGHPRHERK